MTIKNDSLTFDESDFDGLSDLAKKALVNYSGEVPFHVLLGNQASEHVSIAKRLLSQTTASIDPKLTAIVEGLAIADAQKTADAQTCLDQLIALLGTVSK